MQTTQLTKAQQEVVDEVILHLLLGDLNLKDKWGIYMFAQNLCDKRHLSMCGAIFIESLRQCGGLK